jgi:hypothetical protein
VEVRLADLVGEFAPGTVTEPFEFLAEVQHETELFVLCGHLIDLRLDGAREVVDGEEPADAHADTPGRKVLDVFDHGGRLRVSGGI